MLYVIYNKKNKKYRSNAGYDNWTRELDEAAIYRTEKSAVSKLNGELKSAQYHEQTWTGADALKRAHEDVVTWQNCEVRAAKLELV
jgi:hypothetical protein